VLRDDESAQRARMPADQDRRRIGRFVPEKHAEGLPREHEPDADQSGQHSRYDQDRADVRFDRATSLSELPSSVDPGEHTRLVLNLVEGGLLLSGFRAGLDVERDLVDRSGKCER
jgi:hypothetical protein